MLFCLGLTLISFFSFIGVFWLIRIFYWGLAHWIKILIYIIKINFIFYLQFVLKLIFYLWLAPSDWFRLLEFNIFYNCTFLIKFFNLEKVWNGLSFIKYFFLQVLHKYILCAVKPFHIIFVLYFLRVFKLILIEVKFLSIWVVYLVQKCEIILLYLLLIQLISWLYYFFLLYLV